MILDSGTGNEDAEDEQGVLNMDIKKEDSNSDAIQRKNTLKLQAAKHKIGLLKRATTREQILIALQKEKMLQELEGKKRVDFQKDQIINKLGKNLKTNGTLTNMRIMARKTKNKHKREKEQEKKPTGLKKKMQDQVMEYLVETAYNIVAIYHIHEHN